MYLNIAMFDTLEEVVAFYAKGGVDVHKDVYNTFHSNVTDSVRTAFNKADGFGEDAFCWNWKLLVDAMPPTFSCLEIGVYKARTLALIDMYSKACSKKAMLYGITPLTNAADKYSQYPNEDYEQAILSNFTKMGASIENMSILQGYSTDNSILATAKTLEPFDILFIDGCHDYDVVCKDIVNYIPMLNVGGYLVMDDASLFLKNPFGRFLGHEDVARAIRDKIDSDTRLTHMYAVGHNRVWKKVSA